MKSISAIAAILILAVVATAQTNNSSDDVPILGNIPQFHLTTNGLSDAEIQGQQLAKQLCNSLPTENFTNNGVLQIRNANGNQTNVFIRIETTLGIGQTKNYLGKNNWSNHYQTFGENMAESNIIQKALLLNICNTNDSFKTFSLTVTHNIVLPNLYFYFDEVVLNGHVDQNFGSLNAKKTMTPFANSDFWICDLGLEFFHWPEQKIIKKEFARGRGCMVLESTNPNPSPNGYSRVDCWIDEETLGIVQAKAYDAGGKLLKEFEPKSFKKVNGQWELQDMEIRNVQTGSRSQIKFDLGTSNTEHSTSNNQ